MSDVLARICADKLEHIAGRKAVRSFADLDRAAGAAEPPRGFAAALRRAAQSGRYGLIAEIKKASPSKGLIRSDFDPAALALAYQEGGATCISVLTDMPYFQGSDEYLMTVASTVDLPVLRKDFMLDPYQVAEARALGADCILVIMAVLDDATAAELTAAARSYGMDVLVEVHDRAELDRALELDSELIGINNRNLKTLAIDLHTTIELSSHVPADRILVSESGINTPSDLALLASAGARCFLVGESLMRQGDVAAATRTLLARAPAPAPA